MTSAQNLMSTNIRHPKAQTGNLAINVLVKNEQDGLVSAIALGLPEYRVIATDRATAIANLQRQLAIALTDSEVISVEIEIPQKTNPWLQMAGKYKDDPQFDAMLEAISEYRLEADAQILDCHDVAS
jgi:hypothetical protein